MWVCVCVLILFSVTFAGLVFFHFIRVCQFCCCCCYLRLWSNSHRFSFQHTQLDCCFRSFALVARFVSVCGFFFLNFFITSTFPSISRSPATKVVLFRAKNSWQAYSWHKQTKGPIDDVYYIGYPYVSINSPDLPIMVINTVESST